jgi:light-regulated signal transduction histidine kinase (bacteriophytochrome)
MERSRQLAEAATASANELAANSANRLKDEFIGRASHELRMIIELHQGSVGAESEPGRGSHFWFTLPLASQSGSDTGE